MLAHAGYHDGVVAVLNDLVEFTQDVLRRHDVNIGYIDARMAVLEVAHPVEPYRVFAALDEREQGVEREFHVAGKGDIALYVLVDLRVLYVQVDDLRVGPE